MRVKVGTAPDSWGVWFPSDPRQTPWERFLDEVVEAGYDAIELGPFGYLPTDPEALRRELDSRGLQLAGAFIFRDFAAAGAWESARPELEAITGLLLTQGADHLVVINTLYTDLFTGARVGPSELDDATWTSMVDTIRRVADFTAAQGIASVYHPHAETPVEYVHQVERLLGDTDPATLSLCLDFGHIAYGGGDPVALIERYPERIRYLHMKNVDRVLLDRARAEGLSFAEAVRVGTFCDLEQGVIDYVRVRDALVAMDFDGWGIVEQDMYPCEFDRPLPAARRNRDYLRRVGLG